MKNNPKNIAAAGMLAHAQDTVQQRVDTVSVNERGNVFTVYSPHGDKDPHHHSHVNGHDAANVPAEQSVNQIVQVRQQQQEQAQVQAQQKSQTPDDPNAPKGPKLT